MAAPEIRIAPGPRGLPWLGNLFEYRQDRLQFLTESRKRYGDVVRYRLAGHLVHLVNHPDDVHAVMVTRMKNYEKATNLGAIFGNGIFTSSGELWKKQRRTMQPMFQMEYLVSLIPIMANAAATTIEKWDASTDREIDVEAEMMKLALEIVGRALFGTEMRETFARLHPAMQVVNDYLIKRFYSLVPTPDWWPSAARDEFRAAVAAIDEIVEEIVRHERARTEPGRTLVSLLLKAQDPETGEVMGDRQVRDEIVTLLLAGHETTAHSLSWSLWLLSKRPEIVARIRAEVDGQPMDATTLRGFRYLYRVVEESLRLYPAGWAWSRRALADDTLGGYHIPAGSIILVSPYVTQRDSAFWERPEEFDPDRFAPERQASLRRDAYFPFGLGPRLCIGRNLATMEIAVVLAEMVKRFDFAPVAGRDPVADAKVTIGTKDGVWLRVTKREQR